MTDDRPPKQDQQILRPALRPLVAFPLALALIVLDTFWIVQAERVGTGPYFTTISLFANVLLILCGLLIVNSLFRRFAPRQALSQPELLLIYSMVAVGAAMAGQDTLPGLVQMLGHPFRYDNSANGFLDHFGRYLPPALTVRAPDALAEYYQGHSSLYRPGNFQPWLRPVLLWTLFVGLLFWTMQCINVLMRQGWQDRERLPFPVIEIPFQMTDPEGRLWRNRLFWLGFGICALIEAVNGLSYLYPNVPRIPIQYASLQGQGIFATHPWSAAGFTAYSFYPFAIGIGYLLPLDLLFSCWFFYLFWKAQMIFSSMMAWDTTPDFPFVREQTFGSFLSLIVFFFWSGRSYFGQVWRRIWKEPADLSDSDEALSYRQAFWGMVGGFGALVGFMVWAGMSPLMAVTAFGLYFIISLAITRIRAELGPPIHDLHFSGPDYLLTHEFGTASFSARDLTLLSFFYSFNRAYRSHPMPIAIEGLKIAGAKRANQRIFFWGLQLAAVAGALSFFWAYLHLAYRLGTSAKFQSGEWYGIEAYNRLNGWLQQRTPPNGPAGAAVGIGFAFCSLLMLARLRFPGWPLHPIGFAISSSWAINLVWTPLLIAWMIKGLLLRYGGVGLYRQATPFFLGLILGQMITGCLWHLAGMIFDITPYSFWGA